MTQVVDYNEMKREIAYFLRNNDLFTISERGVATSTNESLGTLAADTFVDIPSGIVKNIRSLSVGGSGLTYGTDYTYDVDYSSSACRITFTVAQTGACLVTYDYGSNDIIWFDMPKQELKIKDFPRVGMDIIGDTTDDLEITGDQQLVQVSLSIYVYSNDTDEIDDKIKTIKELIIANKKNFYSHRYLRNIGSGPLLLWDTKGETKIFQRNTDFFSSLNEESA